MSIYFVTKITITPPELVCPYMSRRCFYFRPYCSKNLFATKHSSSVLVGYTKTSPDPPGPAPSLKG